MQLVTLDVTNTCIKVASSVGSIYVNYIYQHYGILLNEQLINKSFHTHFKTMSDEHPNFGCYSGMTCRNWWKEVVDNTFTSIGYHSSSIDINNLYDQFTSPSYWIVYDDVIDCLKELKSNGLTLGVISNFDERLESILHGLKLNCLFDFVICSYNEKVHKPHPQIFHKALSHAGSISGDKCIHIGDSYVNDYQGAIQAGLNALLIIRNKDKQAPTKDIPVIRTLKDVTLHNLSELLKVNISPKPS